MLGSFWQEHWFSVPFAQQAKLQLRQMELAIVALLPWFLYQLQK